MATRLIRLDDGTLDDGILIEVEATDDDIQQVSSRAAEKIQQTLDKVQPLLVATCQPVIAALKEIGQDAEVDTAELELGFAFEGEGSLYITKFKGAANLIVRVSLKPHSTK
jgi:hypothetical protein